MLRDHFLITRHPQLKQELSSNSLVTPLYMVAFVTGILDATTYASFTTFASNQTGNVVLLTIGIANAINLDLRNTAVSLASYLVTGFIGGQIANKVGARSRWWLVVSMFTQILLLVIPTILLFTKTVTNNTKAHEWIFIMFLAMSSGFQVSLARSVGVPEIPSAMLSSPMIDLVIDPLVFSPHWNDPKLRPRNRRMIYITSLISGSLIGAYMHRYAGGLMYVLLIAITLKIIIVLFVLFIRAVPEKLKVLEKVKLESEEVVSVDTEVGNVVNRK